MDILKIIGIAILTTISTLLLKQVKPELSVFSTIAGALIIFLSIAELLTSVIGIFTEILDKTNINSNLFFVLLKIIGVGYITEFGANICSDAGNNSMADKIFFAGKLCVVILSFPIIQSLVDIVSKLINS